MAGYTGGRGISGAGSGNPGTIGIWDALITMTCCQWTDPFTGDSGMSLIVTYLTWEQVYSIEGPGTAG